MDAHEQRRTAEAASARLPRELRGAADVAERTAQRSRDARQRLREVGRHASDSVNRAGKAVRGYARDNPAGSTLAAFGAGLGLGILLARRRSAERRWRSTAPALSAIADAVLQVFERRR